MPKKLVLMDHDGANDDFLAMMLLTTMKNVELLGVVVTPADCYLQSALNVTRKILDLVKQSHIPVAASTVRGVNAFPPAYRKDCVLIDHLPILNQEDTLTTPFVERSGQDFMIQTLRNADRPVTLMVTGPLTTLAEALKTAPDIEGKIAEIVWMGGALTVMGNVEQVFAPEHDGTAEWNVYWDAFAAEAIWQTNLPIYLCPLDVTNQVPVTKDFVRRLAKLRSYPLCDLAGQCYALAATQDYYCWDVLATAYLDRPEFFKVKELNTTIVTTGASEGRTKLVKEGRKINAMMQVDKDEFHNYLLQQWGQDR
jgi:purine nucleosidase